MQQTAEKLPEYFAEGFDDSAERPIVVVGNGPIGMRAVLEIWERLPDRPVVIYGDEQYEPYNRVRLSSWLAGELNWNELVQPLRRPFGAKLEERFGYRVVSIDRDNKFVIDQSGRLQADIEALGIDIIIGDGVKEIFGRERVQGIHLRSGKTLRCDTLIVAAGRTDQNQRFLL